MTILETIKATSLTARKARDKAKADLLSTLIGEIQIIGKNDNNRAPTDVDCIVTLKKFIKNTEELFAAINSAPIPFLDAIQQCRNDKALLESFLPQQLSDCELQIAIDLTITELQATTIKDMGKVMKVLKERHGGLYDGGVASALIKQKLQ